MASPRGTCLRNAITLASCAALLALFATAALKPVAARDGDDQDQRGSIHSEVTLVSMLASVLDKDGRPALGLTADQFEVYEEGVKQKIEVLEPETQQPLDLALMIDSSLSEIKELEFEEDAASRFIQKLVRPADRLAVLRICRRRNPTRAVLLECAVAASGVAAHHPGRRHGPL